MRLLHYLFSLAAHLVSGRLGRSAPASIPLARGKFIPINPLPTWQILVALWLLKKFWQRYGGHITGRAMEQTAKYSGPGAGLMQEFFHSVNPQKSPTVTVDPLSNQAES